MRSLRHLVAATLLLFCACDPADAHDHDGHDDHDDHGHDDHDDHGHDEHGHDDHGHDDHDDHGHDDHDDHGHDDHAEIVTRWGESTFAFVEFTHLIVGDSTTFAVHLTQIAGHRAVSEGLATIELSGGGHPAERFSAEVSSTPGIFRPEIAPQHAGTRQIKLLIESPGATEEHDLGEHNVYANDEAAEESEDEHDHEAPPGAISFGLEEQWNTPFGVERVEARTIRPNFPAFARLSLPNDAESMVTAPRAGRVVAVGGRFPLVGEEVDEGAQLFALSTAPTASGDPATLDLGVDQAAIGVHAAQREVDRLTPLVGQGVVAQRRLDDATSALQGAQAALRSARRLRGSLGQSQRVGGRRDGLSIPSPIAGTIAEIYVAPGAWVTEGQPIARVVDRDRLWLDVGVPEAYVSRLATVSGAWFQLDATGGVLEVPRESLVSIGTELDAHSRTLPVRFRIDNVRRELFAGSSTLAHLVADEGSLAVAVPYSSIVDDGGVDVAYIQTSGELFERRIVRLGERDGIYIEIVEGVRPDEWVVSRGAYAVKIASTATDSLGHGHAH